MAFASVLDIKARVTPGDEPVDMRTFNTSSQVSQAQHAKDRTKANLLLQTCSQFFVGELFPNRVYVRSAIVWHHAGGVMV